MRYQAVHIANVNPQLTEDDKQLAKELAGSSVFHIGCLCGAFLNEVKSDQKSGCEDYKIATSYARKNYKLETFEVTTEVPDKSFDVVVVDPAYYPQQHGILIEEAIRIARDKVIIGVQHNDLWPEEYDNCDTYIINDKYTAFELGSDESSDTTEE